MTKLLLASSSPYRQAQLRQLQLPFTTASPDIDESPLPGESAEALVRRLASAKAEAFATSHPHCLIIGSDQASSFAGTIIGKPGTQERAKEQLLRFSGQTLRFVTGICLHQPSTGRSASDIAVTEVQFQQLTERQIDHYLAREQPYDCAGSFKCESLGISLFERITADDPSALVGLPLITLTRLLAKFDYHPLDITHQPPHPADCR